MNWGKIYPKLARWVDKCGAIIVSDARHFKSLFFGYSWSVAFQINSPQKLIGTGVHKDPQIAKAKAISEMFEREITYSQGLKNTNGCAVSYSRSESKKTALMELLERDRFFLHYINCLPFFSSYELQKIEHSKIINKTTSSLRKMGIEVVFREMMPTNGFHFVVASALGKHFRFKKFGTVVGLGSGTELHEALEKSLCSLLMGLVEVLKSPRSFESPDDHNLNMEPVDPLEYHRFIALGVQYGDWWNSTFLNFFPKKIVHLKPRKVSAKIRTLKCKIFNKKESVVLYWSHAKSKKLQDPVFGKQETIAFRRKGVGLNRQASKKFKEDFNRVFPEKSWHSKPPSMAHPLA